MSAWRLARWVMIGAFAFILWQWWHPFYGFTRFLQADTVTEALLPETLRDAPIFINPVPGRYDGAYYAQIATSPALQDPDLVPAVDNLGYRARRILLSAIAWVLGGGQPVAAVQAYAWLNIIFWFLFAALLWRIFPVSAGWRSAVGWAGLLLASGTMASVRLALTDLAAAVLLAGAVLLLESGRWRFSTALLGLVGLTRETALLGVSTLLPEQKTAARELMRRGILIVLAIVPLAVWLWYVRSAIGPTDAGSANLTLPLAGWLGRWRELVQLTRTEPNHFLLVGGWLDVIALSAQMIYLLWRPQWRDPWWRLGLSFTVLGFCLGPAVWEGLPGAAARVLLPVTLVFNVLAFRRRSALLWLLCGNLSALTGVWSIWTSHEPPAHSLSARTTWSQQYMLETDARWSVAEWNRKWRWAWCNGTGGVNFRLWPWAPRARIELQVRGITPRVLEVWHNQTIVWQGQIGDRPQWISLPELPMERGNLRLELRSEAPEAGRGGTTTGEISFACFGARLVK